MPCCSSPACMCRASGLWRARRADALFAQDGERLGAFCHPARGQAPGCEGSRSVCDLPDNRQCHRSGRRAYSDDAFSAEQALTARHRAGQCRRSHFLARPRCPRAALKITNYRQAIDRVAQTSLARNDRFLAAVGAVGRPEGRRRTTEQRDRRKTAGWGISVTSVEIRDVAIPVALQDAMSARPRRSGRNRLASFWGPPKRRSPGICRRRPIYAGEPAALHCAP